MFIPLGNARLKRNVVVLLPRVFERLVAQHVKGPADALTR